MSKERLMKVTYVERDMAKVGLGLSAEHLWKEIWPRWGLGCPQNIADS